MKRYFIREDYQPRQETATFVERPEDYWNQQRIKSASYYQYYVYMLAAARLGEMPEASFLDVGCGYPTKVQELVAPITDRISLIDQPSMGDLIHSNFPDLTFIPMNLESPDLSIGRRFEVIICADVIEHLMDPDPLLEFLKAVSSPESTIILSTPEREVLHGSACVYSPNSVHVREWSMQEFFKYLDDAGFRVDEQVLLPQGRLSALEERFLQPLKKLQPGKYNGCQVAVCGLKPDAMQ